MAVNTSQSQNACLAEGMSDGKYKKIVQDRGGVIDPVNPAEKADLSTGLYVVQEAPSKLLPDGTRHTTPDYRPL